MMQQRQHQIPQCQPEKRQLNRRDGERYERHSAGELEKLNQRVTGMAAASEAPQLLSNRCANRTPRSGALSRTACACLAACGCLARDSAATFACVVAHRN